MFPEWTDPNDIDHYTRDIDGLMRDIESYPTPSSYRAIAPKRAPVYGMEPETPTGMIVNNPIQKSAYEVSPDTIAHDGHPVGRQPQYNILYSAPPESISATKAEKYQERESAFMYINRDHIIFMMFFVIVVLGVLLAQSRSVISQCENTIRMMFMNMQQNQIPRSRN